MTNVESKIRDFFKSYFSVTDLKVMQQPSIAIGDGDICFQDINKYKEICNYYFDLFGLNPDKWYIETDESGSNLIDKLLLHYYTPSTLICKTQENYGKVIYDIINNKSSFIYTLYVYSDEEYSSLDTDIPIQNIINSFKTSKADHLFLIIPRMIPGFGYILKPDFFVRLKKALLANKIKHTFILDECQAGFYIKDQVNYDLFDGFIITAHLLFPGLSGAILFTKKQGIAHRDLKFLQEFQPKLEILYKTKDKALQFNSLLSEYFDEFKDNNKITICSNDSYPQHQFILHCKDVKPIAEHCKTLYGNYLIRIYEADIQEHWVRMRLEEALVQNPDNVIKGLRQWKKYLNSIIRKNEIALDNKYDKAIRTLYEDNSEEFLKKHLAIYKRFYGTDKIINLANRIKSTLNQYKIQLLHQSRTR